MLNTCLVNDWCEPADANKLRGIKAFAAAGQYGAVGRVGLGMLAQRQYSDSEPWTLSGNLRRALLFLKVLEELAPPRICTVWNTCTPPLVIASDGRVDDDMPPTAGVCVMDVTTNTRLAWWMVVEPELLARWESRHCIMEVEAVPIVALLAVLPAVLAGRDAIWFVDNAAVLSAMIKGGSRCEDVDRAAGVVALICAQIQARVWFEYVESKSNWADGVSRLLHADQWSRQNGFELSQCCVPTWPWLVSVNELAKRLESEVGAALEMSVARGWSSGGGSLASTE